MASNYLAKGLKRSALTVALGLCFVGGVQAQTNTAGAVNGRASAGDTITITNSATGYSRTVTVGGDGGYRFSQVPIGQYTVTRNGANARTATVNVGTAANVDFVNAGGDATTLDTVTVVGSGAINPIDVSSVESTTIMTAEQIAKIPVARDATSVALLAPGTVRGDAAFGNLASFGGASVAENQYYINGFNITNSFRGLNFAQVPFEAVQEQQIKTGGYGAEFGRSLGGVINQITKRGTNEFHAGGNIFYAPKSLREDVKNTYYSNPLACGAAPFTDCNIGELRQDNTQDTADNLVGSVWASGALIKDRLFAYGLIQYGKQEQDTWGSVVANTNVNTSIKTPTWLLKMDWEITDNHRLEFTAFSDKQKTETQVYRNTTYPRAQRDVGKLDRLGLIGTNFQEQGGNNYVLKYTGFITDNFTLSALYGRSDFSRAQHLLTAGGVDVRYGGDLNHPATGCPVITDLRSAARIQATGLYTSQCNISGGAIAREDSGDKRDQFRIDAEWQLGDHLLRFGIDTDNFESVDGTSTEGGRVWRYTTLANGTDVVREQIVNQGSTNEVKQRALYIQDSWNITDNFIAYVGGRWDTFDNRDGFGNSFVKINNQFGPRLGFSWDVYGDSSFKVFGNAGRYALPLTADVATRAASASLFTRQQFTFTGVDPLTGAPLGLTPRVGSTGVLQYINGEFGDAKNPATVAATNLKPMYQDEFILGFQKALNENFTLGVRGIHRDLKAAIDDNCDYTPIMAAGGFSYNTTTHTWRNAAGQDAVIPGSGFPYCRIFNPGEDAVYLTDFLDNGTLTEVTVPGATLSPPAKRKYTALEFFFEGSWDKFFLQGSYTFAKSIGNTEGGVKSDIGQQNTNTTQDFDYLELTVDTYGYLPNDRRHTLKLFGNWEMTDEWSLGANVLVQSGRPLNCFGVLDRNPGPGLSLHPYGSSFLRCGTTPAGATNDATVVARPRGTAGRLPWTSNLDLNVAYKPMWAEGLQFKIDIFNVFNRQKVVSVNEVAEDAVSGLPLDTYLLPTAFQAPRQVRFMVQYDF